MKELIFNEEKHQYLLNEKILPSVTQIVREVLGVDYSKIPTKNLQQAGERGTQIHREVETGNIQSIEAGWIEKNIARKSCIFEERFYCDFFGFLFAGTADIVGVDTVFDIKTQIKDDIEYWTLQLNLYNQFFKKEKLKVLHTPKTGLYKIIDIPILTEEQIKEVIKTYQKKEILRGDFFMNEKKELVAQPIKLELEVYKHNVGELTTNAKELEAQIDKQLEFYNIENYSVENVEDAKKDKAGLNKAVKLLNSKRLEIEKEFMKPIEEFKSIMKRIDTKMKTASGKLDVIVKEVDDKEKEGKKNNIIKYFEALNFNTIDFEQIFNPKWLNKTVKMDAIQKEIEDIISKIKNDLIVLDRLGEEEARVLYLSSLNLELALQKADEIKANRERLKQLEVETAENKRKEKEIEEKLNSIIESLEFVTENEARDIFNQSENIDGATKTIETLEVSRQKLQNEQESEEIQSDEKQEEVDTDLYTVEFSATGTQEQLEKLQNFMELENIKFKF